MLFNKERVAILAETLQKTSISERFVFLSFRLFVFIRKYPKRLKKEKCAISFLPVLKD